MPIASLDNKKHAISRGEHIAAHLHRFAVKPALYQLPKLFTRLSPLLAAPTALLLSQQQAKAALTYNIFESAGDVVVQTSGSLDLTGATLAANIPNSCIGNVNGALVSAGGIICNGPNSNSSLYFLSGPQSFNGSVEVDASSVSGVSTLLLGVALYGAPVLGINPAYLSSSPIVSSATFNGTTLASLGFTTTGLIGTWTLNGTSETIQVFLGPPSAAAVPGPLPLLGAGAAFAWSRLLRKRIAAPLIAPPQA